MDTLHIYDKLLQFALFQGLSKNELNALVTYTKLGFHKYGKGEPIAKQQMSCNRLFFLIDGRVDVTSSSDNGSYTVTENAEAPLLFEPEALFGVSPHFTSGYTAATPCSIIFIDKSEIYKLLDHFDIFRINYLNLLSALIQKRHVHNWHSQNQSIAIRILDFVKCHSRFVMGEKHVDIKMTRLAQELGCSRLDISQALHQLENQKLVVLYRGGFKTLDTK